jgi:hypothetical protein
MVRYWLAAALYLTMSSVSVAQRICDAEGYVGDRTPDPLSISTSLSEGGKAYPLRAQSAVSEGYGRTMLCFQYQILNAGAEAIPLVNWYLVDDYTAKDLNVKESRFRNRSRPTTFEGPIKAQTKINGLRSAQTQAPAWQTVEDAGKTKESNALKDPIFSFAKASTLDPTIASAVRSGFLPDDDVAVLDRNATQGDVGPVSDAIGSDDGFVFALSSITLKDRTFLGNFFKIKLAPNSQVSIFSPFLSALMKEPTETAQLLDGIFRYSKEPTPLVATSANREAQFPYVKYPSTQKLYVVEHPITIKWQTVDNNGVPKTSVQCARIASYSPFPVSLNERFCVR